MTWDDLAAAELEEATERARQCAESQAIDGDVWADKPEPEVGDAI